MRRRGLGYTAEEHARSAALDARSFRKSVGQVKRALASGDCTTALHFLGMAQRSVGAYAADRAAAMQRARGRIRGGLATGARMSQQLVALEDKLLWCTWKKHGRR